VYPGEAATVWRRFGGGTDPNRVLGEGFHLMPPWNKVYIYDLRLQQLTETDEMLAQNGLSVRVQSSIRFRPVPLGLPQLNQRFGFDYVTRVVRPELISVVQTIVGRFTPEQLYTLPRLTVQQDILTMANSSVALGKELIEVEDIVIMRVELPPAIQTAIQLKLEQEQVALQYDFRLSIEQKEAIRKRIEAEGIAEYQRIISGNLNDRILTWRGIQATEELAKSPNAKVVVIGGSKTGLPLVLGNLTDSAK
jgi:regulator of protease activity HflC (stomatin/prohibitin superfamily)